MVELLLVVHVCLSVHFSTGDRQLGPESPEAIEFAQTTNKKAGIRVSVCACVEIRVSVCACVEIGVSVCACVEIRVSVCACVEIRVSVCACVEIRVSVCACVEIRVRSFGTCG